MAEKEEYEAKLKELEGVVQPIMTRMYQAGATGGMPEGGMSGGFPGAGATGDSSESSKPASSGPKIEEVD